MAQVASITPLQTSGQQSETVQQVQRAVDQNQHLLQEGKSAEFSRERFSLSRLQKHQHGPEAGKAGNPAQQPQQFEQLKEAINEALKPIKVKLDFSVDQDLDEVVVKVKNSETSEVIRQIPPEAMLNMAKRLEELSGIFIDQRY